MTVHFRLNLELCVNPYSYLTHKTTYDYITRSTYSVYREVTIFDLFCVYWRWGKSMDGAWESAFCCNRSLSCWPCSSMFASKVAICSFSQRFADQVLTAVSPPLHQLYHRSLARYMCGNLACDITASIVSWSAISSTPNNDTAVPLDDVAMRLCLHHLEFDFTLHLKVCWLGWPYYWSLWQ